MKKRIKLFITIAILCMSLATMIFGVFSALSVIYTTSGTVSYDIEDAYAEIETRVYSTSKSFDGIPALKTYSKQLESSTFDQLDLLTTTGLVEGATTHNFNKVQIKNLDKGNDYTVQSSDYVYTYSSVASREEPEDLGLNLKYQSAKDSQKGVYTYIVITKIKNKSSVPIYAFVPESGEDKYVAPENSFTYKLDEDYKTLDGLNSEKYIVFTMSLADKTKSIDAAEFVFPIVITKDILILPEDTDEVQKVGHLAAYEVANIQTVQTKVELSSTPATIDIPFLTLATAEIDYMLLNFHIKQRAQALPENIQLSFSISAVSGTMSCTSYVNEVMVFNGSYKDIVECLENLAQNLTVTGSLSGDVYTVNIPTNRFAIDGTANFTMIVSTQPYGLAEMMYGYGFTDVQYQLTSSVTGIETIVETENVEWNITDYYKIGNVYSITTQNEDILQSMGFAYSLSNYQIRKLDDTIEKISISISSKNAEAMFILTGGIKHSLTINEIYAMGEDPNLITVGLLKDVAQVNLPITLNQEGLMDFCVCVLYNAEQVKQGNDVSVTLSTSYETKEDQQPTNLSYVLAVDGNNKLFYDVVGMIDQTQSTVTIPAYYNNIPVTLIDDMAFAGNENITTVIFEDNSNVARMGYEVFKDCVNLQTVNFGQNSKLKQIDRESFAGCTKLQTITLPNSATTLSNSVFANCSKLKNVTLPNILETIDYGMFENCVELTQINIPQSVTTINSNAFKGCTKLETINISNNIKHLNSTSFDGTKWIETNVTNGIHTNSSGTKFAIKLPTGATVFDFTGVKVIAAAFASETALTTITNLETVQYICSSAFSNCSSLTNFSFGNSSVLKEIGRCAFYGCKTLTSITVPYGVEVLTYEIFMGCSNLATVNLPNSLKEIEGDAFYNCEALNNLQIPSGVTEIGGGAFSYCKNLTTIDLPNNLTYIGENIFEETPIDTALKSTKGIYTNSNGVKYAIKLPANVTSVDFTGVKVIADRFAQEATSLSEITNLDDVINIGYRTFFNTNIETVIFGENAKITGFEEYLFFGCKNLQILVIPKTVTYIGYAAIYEHEYLHSIFYGSTQEDFEKIEKGADLFALDTATIYYYSSTQPTQAGNYWHYVNGVPTVW